MPHPLPLPDSEDSDQDLGEQLCLYANTRRINGGWSFEDEGGIGNAQPHREDKKRLGLSKRMGSFNVRVKVNLKWWLVKG